MEPEPFPLQGATPGFCARIVTPQAGVDEPTPLDLRVLRKRIRLAEPEVTEPPQLPAVFPELDDDMATDGEHDFVHPSKRRMTVDRAPDAGLDAETQLVLPLPSASPVQLAKATEVARLLADVPTTQAGLAELVVALNGHILPENRNHVVFRLVQRLPRLLLLYFHGLISHNLRRDLLSCLPVEVLLKVLQYLDLKLVLTAGQVCKLWRRLATRALLWCRLLLRDRFILTEEQLERELQDPGLIPGWRGDNRMCKAQVLYKKRWLIFRRWMDKLYVPRRFLVAGYDTNIVTCLQHDSERVITGIDGKFINIYSTRTGALLQQLKGHDGGVWALKYFSNTLVLGSTDRDVRIWNIRTGRCSHVLKGHTSTVRCLDILHPVRIGTDDNGTPIVFPPEPLIVTGSRDNLLNVWRLPLDNERLDAAAEVQVYESKEANPYFVALLTGHTQLVRLVSGYGNLIVSGLYDALVRVWDLLQGGKCIHHLKGHLDRIYLTVLDFKRRRCYTGLVDLNINVWDLEKGKLHSSLEGHTSLVGLLDMADGYLVSAAADATLRIWDPRLGKDLFCLGGHSHAITCFQHDGLRVVSGSERMLKLWDISTGRFVRDLLLDITGGIWQVRFDPDRCVAAVQKGTESRSEAYIEVLDFSEPLYGSSSSSTLGSRRN